jgi:pyridoxine kinase
MAVVGSTRTSTGKARLFKIQFPVFDCYFSGTGDMFAALMVIRMREAVYNSGNRLKDTVSWLSGDAVAAVELPLAKAAEKVLASMHELLKRTSESMETDMQQTISDLESDKQGLSEEEMKKKLHLLKSRGAELRLVRNLGCLRNPNVVYPAEGM